MHFGLPNSSLFPRLTLLICCAFLFACHDDQPTNFSFKSPEQGVNLISGEPIKLQIEAPKSLTIDSVRYLLDGSEMGKSKGNELFNIKTDQVKLGYRMVTAIISHGDAKDTIETNVVIRTNVAPLKLSYKVVNTFPHDTSAYTEGLSYIDGKFLESTGEKGASKLKWVDVKSGRSLKEATLEPQYFGEGSLKIGSKIIMLTWREDIGFIFDANTFKQIGTFPYQSSREGWGLTFDGKRILRSDGTNRIWYMDPEKFTETGYLEVYDQKGAVDSLNELEYIDGKIYANVYLTTKIVRIDPVSGRVEAELDLAGLVPKNYFKSKYDEDNNVLNGIAWDEKGKRLFVVGKKWPKLYEISLSTVPAK